MMYVYVSNKDANSLIKKRMQILDCIHNVRERSSFCAHFTNHSTAILIVFHKSISLLVSFILSCVTMIINVIYHPSLLTQVFLLLERHTVNAFWYKFCLSRRHETRRMFALHPADLHYPCLVFSDCTYI